MIVALLACGQNVHAAATASDNASDPAYSSSWSGGENGGSGFNPWTLASVPNSGGSGYFIYDSTSNGGSGSGNPGASLGINSSGNNSFGLYAYSTGYDDGYRSFTPGTNGSPSLQVNQDFTIQMDNGYVSSGVVGIGLQDSSGDNRFEFYFAGGSSDYTLVDGSGTTDSGIGYTDGGLTLSYVVTGINTYSLTVTRDASSGQSGTTMFTFSGLDNGSTAYDISQVHIFDSNGSGGNPYNFYVNNLSIATVPEPGCASILVGTFLMGLRGRRRTTR
jgi:hypothetical protein